MPCRASGDSEAVSAPRSDRPHAQAARLDDRSVRSELLNCRLQESRRYRIPDGQRPGGLRPLCRWSALGIAEAKRLSLGPQNVLTQAERYSKGFANSPFNFCGYRVPFLYSTNGEVLWFHDIRHTLNRSRRIVGFHTPAALAEMLGRDLDQECRWFQEHPNNHSRLRPYQIEANAAIEKAIADRKRQMLVAMATGTGKTFTMVNQTYRLMESKVGKRILFLVDRRALAAQAVRAFASFEPEPSKKFDKIHEVYSQRFQREDFGEDERFDPKVLPAAYLTEPPGQARLRLRLHHPADGHQPFRPRGRLVRRRG